MGDGPSKSDPGDERRYWEQKEKDAWTNRQSAIEASLLHHIDAAQDSSATVEAASMIAAANREKRRIIAGVLLIFVGVTSGLLLLAASSHNEGFYGRVSEGLGTACLVVATVEAATRILTKRFTDPQSETDATNRAKLNRVVEMLSEAIRNQQLERQLKDQMEQTESERRQADQKVQLEEMIQLAMDVDPTVVTQLEDNCREIVVGEYEYCAARARRAAEKEQAAIERKLAEVRAHVGAPTQTQSE
jgi:hypothetical protein